MAAPAPVPGGGRTKRSGTVIDIPAEERPVESADYKVAPKVAVEDLLKKDSEDESLRRYKESLLGGAAKSGFKGLDQNDPRHVIVKKFEVLVDGRPPIVFDPNDAKLEEKPYTLKGGCTYKLKIDFYVQHDIVQALKFHNVVYKFKIRVDKSTEVIGSFAPSDKLIEFTFPEDEAPSMGGHFTAVGRLVDDDGIVHLEFNYSFDIKKEWDQ